MAITELPPAPTSGNPTNFSNKGDALLGSFATFITQTNSTSADVDTKSTNVDTKNTNVNTKQQQASLDEASALASKNSASASASVTVTKANDCVAPTDTTIAKALEANNSESSALTSASTANNTVLNVVSNRASIRPTLLLDFAKTKFMDPRVTFTRSSVATVTDSLGVIRTVASDVPRFDHDPITGESLGLLMEESRTNLITYSDNFDVGWSKSRATIIPNTTIAPDGSMTGSFIREDTSNTNTHAVTRGIAVTVGLAYTTSIFAKASTRNCIYAQVNDPLPQYPVALINLSNLTFGDGSRAFSSVKLKDVGNGWVKCDLTFVAAASGTALVTFGISTGTTLNSNSYTGDGTSGIYIWRGGLEAGAFPTSSIETPAVFTGRSSTGTFIGSNGLIQTAASGVARYQYTPTDLTIPPYLLLETASTNVFTNSEITNSSTGTTVVPNSSVAPDGTNTMDFIGEQATTGEHYAQDRQYAVTAGTSYVFSVFIKDGAKADRLYYHRVALTGSIAVTFDPRTKTFVITSGNPVVGYQELPNGIFRVWYRYTAEITANAVHRAQLFKAIGGASYLGELDSGMYVWGAQLELADNISSYIPTTSSQVTRAADTSTSSQVTRAADSAVMTGVNFSSWYRQDEGSIYAETRFQNSAGVQGETSVITFLNGSSSDNQIRINRESNGLSRFRYRANATDAAILTAGTTVTGTNKYCISYVAGFQGFSVNGGAVSAANSVTVPQNLNSLFLGRFNAQSNITILNGTIAKLAYYPKRLTNTELVGITQ
jgi:hypothetical protein